MQASLVSQVWNWGQFSGTLIGAQWERWSMERTWPLWRPLADIVHVEWLNHTWGLKLKLFWFIHLIVMHSLTLGNQSEHSHWSDASQIDTVCWSAPTCSHQQCSRIWKLLHLWLLPLFVCLFVVMVVVGAANKTRTTVCALLSCTSRVLLWTDLIKRHKTMCCFNVIPSFTKLHAELLFQLAFNV